MNKTSFVISLIVVILFFVIGYLIGRYTIPTTVDIRYEYKTDTLRLPIHYPGPTVYKDTAKPRIVIEYLEDTTKYQVSCDSLIKVIDSLGNIKSVVSNSFVGLYPTSPKLISLGLAIDTLSLTLLDIEGHIKSYNYPLWLQTEKYIWANNVLTYKKVPLVEPRLKNPLSVVSYIYYDFSQNSFGAEGRVNKKIFKRLQVEGVIGYTIYVKQLNLKGGVIIPIF